MRFGPKRSTKEINEAEKYVSDVTRVLEKNVSLMGLNVCGVASKLRYDILPKFVEKFDIICLSETKLFNIPESDFPNFVIHSLKQKSALHGLSVLVRSDLFPFSKKLNTRSKCVLWVSFGYSKNDVVLIVGSVYIPGDGSKFADKNDYNIISEDITAFYSKYECPFLLLGDFNSRTGKLCDFYNPQKNGATSQAKIDLDLQGIITERFNCDKKVDTYGRNLINMCRDLNLKIVNGRFGSDGGKGEFTCHKPTGKSVVDYAILSDYFMPYISNFCIEAYDCCLSDVHAPICVDIKIGSQASHKQKSPNPPNSNWEKIKFKSSWKPEAKNEFHNSFNTSDIMLLSENLLNMRISDNPTQADIDNIAMKLTSVIVDPAKQVGLCKKIKTTNSKPRINPRKPWFNEGCEKNRRKYLAAKNSVWEAKNQEEKDQCIKNMKIKGKEYKMHISQTQKSFNRDLQKNLRELRRHHPKEYWKILNAAEGSIKNTAKVGLGDFEKHFKSLNEKKESVTPEFNPENIETMSNPEINTDFTLEEVLKSIKDLSNNKSEGGDLIKNEYLKNCPKHVVNLIVELFNLILRTGLVPAEWGTGLIIPIFKKKGSPQDANNYRGVTLLSCLGKLFTVCINVRLTKFADSKSIIGEEQAGFREGYSTQDHIFVFNELIQIYLNQNKRLYCCFIDYKKAFDTINRSLLWGKLIEKEINGKILKVVYNMYENAKSCVKEKSLVSGLFACNMGVRQGENLSPFLFAIFLNDFEHVLRSKYNGLRTFEHLSSILSTNEVVFFLNLYTLLYADDTLVLAETPAEMQLAMNEVHAYCDRWELSINQTKTKVVIFSRGKVKTEYNFKMGNFDIATSSEYCYLGILFNFNGKFSKAVCERITPARKAMYGLNEKALNLQLAPDIHIDLFDKMVMPIFLYGCEIWGYGNNEPLEIFYRKFLKRVLGLNKSTPNCMVYGELGKRPLLNLIHVRMLSFWVKVSEGKPSKLSTIMYNLIYKLHLNGIYDSPWLLCIKKILCNSGNPIYWHQQEALAPKKFMQLAVSKQLEDQYLQKWNSDIDRNRKCTIYRVFKENMSMERYLIKLDFIERRNLCRFRTGNHKLPITESRYVEGGGGVDATCKVCNSGDICDEYHVLFICRKFEVQRKKYLKKYFYVNPSTYKMNLLFNSNLIQLSKLAKFTKDIMTKF